MTIKPIYTGLLFLFLTTILSLPSKATHNLAAHITLQQNDPTNPNSYTITLITYSDPSEAQVDRCSADLHIYSTIRNLLVSQLKDVPRSNGASAGANYPDCNIQGTKVGVQVRGPVKRNEYKIDYVFPGPGEYYVHYWDIARLSNISNICSSNEKSLTVVSRIFVQPSFGNNSTPDFLSDPIYDVCAGRVWTHNPQAIDLDGDSLVYYLVENEDFDDNQPFDPQNNPRPRCYTFPDDQNFFPLNGAMTMDSTTGLITWNLPNEVGIYNISYVVEEYRNGQYLGFIQRDMALFVNGCDNDGPEIILDGGDEVKVIAGDVLSYPFRVFDPNTGDSLYLRGAIAGEQASSFSTSNALSAPVDTISGSISWQTSCGNIRSQFYSLNLFAYDNFNYSVANDIRTTMSQSKVVKVEVLPPGPGSVALSQWHSVNTLSWQAPNCQDQLLGYRIYRKVGKVDTSSISCCPDLQELGFKLVEARRDLSFLSWIDPLDGLSLSVGDTLSYAVSADYGEFGNDSKNVFESAPMFIQTSVQTSVNIDELPTRQSLSIRPNPGTGIFSIFVGGTAISSQWEVRDLKGMLIRTLNLSSQQENIMDLSLLPQGIYLLMPVDHKDAMPIKFNKL